MLGLDSALESIVPSNKPDNLDFIYYLFWRKGIDINRMAELPLPYIFNILKTHSYVKLEEEKALKRQRR